MKNSFKFLTIIAIICLGLIIWINFIDFKFNELVAGKSVKFEYLIESFSLSFIAAYFFYLLNVYIVEKKEKKFILPLVAKNVIGIISNNHSIIKCLKRDDKLSLKYFPTKKEFESLLSNINLKDKIPYFYKNENWNYLFKNRQTSTLDSINRIFMTGKHLDDRLRRILLEMQFSLYLKEDYGFNSNEFEEVFLSKYHVVFDNYFKSIKELKDYYDTNLKSYYYLSFPTSFRKVLKK